ncbi:MAG: hypothetical protein KBT33_05530 [Prevotellaceae bacterium]|nr:hypothetical protein [Candidatus Minthosoma equi]
MKKLIITLALAAIGCTNMFAQMTPEAVLGLRPTDTPSVEQIAQHSSDYNEYVDEWITNLAKGIEQCEQSLNKTMGNVELHARNDANKAARQLGASDMHDLETKLNSMTPAQRQKWAMAQASKRAASYGFDLSKVHEGMSEQEKREQANQAMAHNTGGLTIDDMEFIYKHKLNAKETQDFLKAAGIDESVMEKMNANKHRYTPAQQRVINAYAEAATPIKVYREEFNRKVAAIADSIKYYKEQWNLVRAGYENPETIPVEVRYACALRAIRSLHPMYLDLAGFIKIHMSLIQKEDDYIDVIDQINGTETRKAMGQWRKQTTHMALDYLIFTKHSAEFPEYLH